MILQLPPSFSHWLNYKLSDNADHGLCTQSIAQHTDQSLGLMRKFIPAEIHEKYTNGGCQLLQFKHFCHYVLPQISLPRSDSHYSFFTVYDRCLNLVTYVLKQHRAIVPQQLNKNCHCTQCVEAAGEMIGILKLGGD